MGITKKEYLAWADEKVLEKTILTAGVESLILHMDKIDVDKISMIVSVYKEAVEDLDRSIKHYREEAEKAED